jgi:hypothetical protein
MKFWICGAMSQIPYMPSLHAPLPLDGVACCTETSVTSSNQLAVIYRETWIIMTTALRTTDYAKRNHTAYRWLYLNGSVDWCSNKVSGHYEIPRYYPYHLYSLNNIFASEMSFSGHVHNMANGEWMEHQYRVDKKALYTYKLTVWICMWMLCVTLSVPLHMMGTYSYWECCYTPPSSFTVYHVLLHAHTDWHGRYIRCGILWDCYSDNHSKHK